jgi:hypothetical protein
MRTERESVWRQQRRKMGQFKEIRGKKNEEGLV